MLFQKPLQAPASGSGQQSQIAVVRLRMKLRFINTCLTHVRLFRAIHGPQNFWNSTPGSAFKHYSGLHWPSKFLESPTQLRSSDFCAISFFFPCSSVDSVAKIIFVFSPFFVFFRGFSGKKSVNHRRRISCTRASIPSARSCL